jgi:hypothetical protein
MISQRGLHPVIARSPDTPTRRLHNPATISDFSHLTVTAMDLVSLGAVAMVAQELI